MITPIIIAREKPFKISPPRIKIEIKANKVVVEVITVLDKVSLIDLFEISYVEKEISMLGISLKMFFVVTVPVIIGMLVRKFADQFILKKMKIIQRI